MPIKNVLQSEGWAGGCKASSHLDSLMPYVRNGKGLRCRTWNVSMFTKIRSKEFSKLQLTCASSGGLHEIRNPEYEAIWDKYTQTKS
jgi:hypothetical protein